MEKELKITLYQPEDNSINPFDDLTEGCGVMYWDRWRGYHWSTTPSILEKVDVKSLEDLQEEYQDFMHSDPDDWNVPLDTANFLHYQGLTLGVLKADDPKLTRWEKFLTNEDLKDNPENWAEFLSLYDEKEWNDVDLCGYSQGDVVHLVFPCEMGEVKEVKKLEDYYWGGYYEVRIQHTNKEGEEDEDYWTTCLMYDDNIKDCIKDICADYGIDPKDAIIQKQEGYVQVPNFKDYSI